MILLWNVISMNIHTDCNGTSMRFNIHVILISEKNVHMYIRHQMMSLMERI